MVKSCIEDNFDITLELIFGTEYRYPYSCVKRFEGSSLLDN